MKIKIYWKTILATALFFSIIAILVALILDQFIINFWGKIPLSSMDASIDLSEGREKARKILIVGVVIESILVSITLLILGVVVSKKVEKNKILNAGLAGAALMLILNITFFAYNAYIKYKLNKLSNNLIPLVDISSIIFYSKEIPFAFVVSVIGAVLFLDYQKNRGKSKMAFIKLKKSQAALEFLMTYGWVIAISSVAIVALAYFGVLSPDRFFPSKCFIRPGIGCIDFKISSTSITLVLKNSLHSDIDTIGLWIGDCGMYGYRLS